MIQTTGFYTQSNCMKVLNRNRITDKNSDKVVKAMGMAACQGLCITYALHSKAFCH